MVFESINALDKAVLVQTVPVQPVVTEWLNRAGVSLDILRLDQLDPEISGNKWFKLKHNLLTAQKQGKSTVLSFGGVWSNHIHALAAAGHRFGLDTIGVIRGETVEPISAEPISACLQDAVRWGMKLHYLSRSDYRRKNEPLFRDQLLSSLSLTENEVHIVPEGGSNQLGVLGCREILASGSISAGQYDEIWLACGTGATLAGISLVASSQLPGTQVIGVAVLKGADFLRNDIREHTGQPLDNWSLLTDYHHGGYAHTTKELLSFIRSFENETGVDLDPVYTGKVMFAIKYSLIERLKSDKSCRGERLLMVHTGGLQGRRGIKV